MDAYFMSLELHDRGIHAISADGSDVPLVTAGQPGHRGITGPPAYAGLNPQDPSSLVYAINVPHHAPILRGAMYIMPGKQNGPQIGGSLTRWHSHLTMCQDDKPTIAGSASS